MWKFHFHSNNLCFLVAILISFLVELIIVLTPLVLGIFPFVGERAGVRGGEGKIEKLHGRERVVPSFICARVSSQWSSRRNVHTAAFEGFSDKINHLRQAVCVKQRAMDALNSPQTPQRMMINRVIGSNEEFEEINKMAHGVVDDTSK